MLPASSTETLLQLSRCTVRKTQDTAYNTWGEGMLGLCQIVVLVFQYHVLIIWLIFHVL